MRIKVFKPQEADVIILEADGLIDKTHGYGFSILKRLNEFNIKPALVSIVDNAEALYQLPKRQLIFSGGMTEVTADVDWVTEAKKFVSEVVMNNKDMDLNDRTPIFGICFGAQLIAEALVPGSVTYLEDPEIGISTISLDFSKHNLFNGLQRTFDAYSFHYNQIKPGGLESLSSHTHMGHQFLQAFEISNASVFGVQFHPEFRQSEMKKLLDTYRTLIGELGFDVNPIIADLPEITDTSLILKNFYEFYGKRNHLA
jgi:GMP synthase-like glutamine amidotransferase